jgi:hypothetical protein
MAGDCLTDIKTIEMRNSANWKCSSQVLEKLHLSSFYAFLYNLVTGAVSTCVVFSSCTETTVLIFFIQKIYILWNRVIFKKPLVVQQEKKFAAFCTVVQYSYLQRPVAGHCINPDASNPHPHALFLNFNIKPFCCQFPRFDTWYICLRSHDLFITYPEEAIIQDSVSQTMFRGTVVFREMWIGVPWKNRENKKS